MKMNFVRKKQIPLILLLSAFVLFGISNFFSCKDGKDMPRSRMEDDKNEDDSPDTIPLGLYVDSKGVLMFGGKPFYGVGINYYDGFRRNIFSESDTSYIEGLEYLSHLKIPFIRFNIGDNWPIGWDLYLNHKDEYFRRLDRFVRYAEKYNIGLIPDLFWHSSTFPDIVGENVNQLGNPNSKTMAFIRNFTKEVVTRYKDSPAIWGWEFANETNLRVNLPQGEQYLPQIAVGHGTPATRSEEDRIFTSDLVTVLTEFAKTVRLYDSTRVIFSGNSNERSSAFNLFDRGSWDRDNIDQYNMMLNMHNPDPINTITIHVYPNQEFDRFAGNPATLDKIIYQATVVAKKWGKPLFLGEFAAKTSLNEEEKMRFEQYLGIIKDYKIQISALWVFDYPTQEDANIRWDSPLNYQLERVSQFNAEIASE